MISLRLPGGSSGPAALETVRRTLNSQLLVTTQRRARPGFSLVELLVVAAITGVLMALALSAVQAARESARRTQCGNNLKQVGLGVLHHHEVRHCFPTAGTNSEDFTSTPKQDPGFERLGWGFQILPYIEQSTLYNAGKGQPPTAPLPSLGNRSLAEITIPTFICPSRGVRTANDVSRYGVTYALGDYAGITFGFIGDLQWRNSHNDEDATGLAYRQYAWRGVITKGGHNFEGVYHRWPTVRANDVCDGLSNTLVMMEKAVWSQRYSLSTASSAAMTCEVFGWAHNAHQPTMRSISGDGGLAFGGTSGNWSGSPGRGEGPLIRGDDDSRGGQRDWDQGFGSAHTGIVLAMFGDGSVRSISEEIDQSMGGTLFRLGCRDDALIFAALSQSH
jgi:prepilin-type N-terminal cleavage/methylation domain-containing protein